MGYPKIYISILLFLPFMGWAQKAPIKFPPLSMMVRSPSHASTVLPLTSYPLFWDKDTHSSILSPKEIWDALKTKKLKETNMEKIAHFYHWYFTSLPLIIFSHKRTAERTVDMISENTLHEIGFLFESEQPLTAKKITNLTKKYNYTEPEKWNLFLTILYKNISDKELLKVLKKWNRGKNKVVYFQDLKPYFNDFVHNNPNMTGQNDEKQNIVSFLTQNNQPLTSLLHEAFKANRLSLFYEISKHFKTNINSLDYLSQTVLHKVVKESHTKASAYLSLLLKHPQIQLNVPDFQGWTPLFYAVAYSENQFFPTVKTLLSQKPKIKVDIMDHDRRTLPLLAVELNKPDLAEFLHKAGAPLPKYISLQNSYMDEHYNVIKLEYQAGIHLNKLAEPLSWLIDRPSFSEFQGMDLNKISLTSSQIWHRFKYYFLLQTILHLLNYEERARHNEIMSLLLDDNYKNSWTAQTIRAIYRGDKKQLQKSFPKQKLSLIENPLFYIQYNSFEPYHKRALLHFNLLKRVTIVPSPSSSQEDISFSVAVGSLLDEAIRANQLESVSFFLEKGLDPTHTRQNIVLKNSLTTAILMGDLFLTDPENYKEHLKIIDLLMNHPSVTADFLSSSAFLGLTYPELATLRGHLPALKAMYQKDVLMFHRVLWDTFMSIPDIAGQFGFFKTKEFILHRALRQNPKAEDLKEELALCQKAFH